MMFVVGCSKITLETKCCTQQYVFLRRQWPTRYATVLGVSRSRSIKTNDSTNVTTADSVRCLQQLITDVLGGTLYQTGRDLEFNI